MKDYVKIEKSISQIITKLNKLKKTARGVCMKLSTKKSKISKKIT
jgi:hypothetical protein